jgi:hypothetical protein
LSAYFQNIALSQAVLISYTVSRLKVCRFICTDLKDRRFVTRHRANIRRCATNVAFATGQKILDPIPLIVA